MEKRKVVPIAMREIHFSDHERTNFSNEENEFHKLEIFYNNPFEGGQPLYRGFSFVPRKVKLQLLFFAFPNGLGKKILLLTCFVSIGVPRALQRSKVKLLSAIVPLLSS
jgi:hypothetical protein